MRTSSTSPARDSGKRPRIAHVALQPTPLARPVPASASRYSSGSPYTRCDTSSGSGCAAPYQRSYSFMSARRTSADRSATFTPLSRKRRIHGNDAPCGSARKTTSGVRSDASSGEMKARSGNDARRCGWTFQSGLPARLRDTTHSARIDGCPASSRRTSPPAMPPAPKTSARRGAFTAAPPGRTARASESGRADPRPSS